MGCALAYQLARRGLEVLLLERDVLGGGSTGRCAGGVRQQFSSEVNVRLQRLAVRLLLEFDEETGGHAGFRQIGYLFLLTTPGLVDDFRCLLEMWRRLGLEEARWVTPAEIKDLVPALEVGDVLGGTYCPTDGLASPADVTLGYAQGARRFGARLLEGVAVTGLAVRDGRLEGVLTTEGRVPTRLLFDCAGAWSAEIGRMAGLELPVVPYRRHALVTTAVPEVGRATPMTVDLATSLYLHPEGEGVLVGMSDWSEPPTFNTEVDWEFVERMAAAATDRLPALGRAGLKTAWAGLYEITPDRQALLGPAPGLEGFWCACGFSGHGFMQAPAAALVLAQLLLEGRSEVDVSSLSPHRFARGELAPERAVI